MQHNIPCTNVESILNSLSEAVFTIDLDRRITSVNKAAELLTGFNRWEAVGRKCRDVINTRICGSACPFTHALSAEGGAPDMRTFLRNSAGRDIPIRISTSLLYDEAGAPVGAVETVRDMAETEQLRRELAGTYSFRDMIGKSPAMQKLFDLLPRVAESTSSVVVEGETGTGKELVARALHDLSPRSQAPFVALNCGALPDALLESELFGYKAGAFTDARKDKPGRFELARGGTIFLDEIADISPAMQVRLLRVLQENQVEPLGSVKPVPVNVRVIVATNRPLETLVKQGRFRQDLYYRIKVIHLVLPPLRSRKEDIPLLVEGIIAKYNQLQDKEIDGVNSEAMALLMVHYYPGNVRELENVIEQAFVLRDQGMITPDDLPVELRGEDNCPPVSGTLESLERSAIEEALRRAAGHRRRAAHELGIDVSTLYRKMKALGIQPPAADGRGGSQ